MFSEKEVINAEFDELLKRFEKIVTNKGLSCAMFRPSCFDEMVRTIIQERFPEEIIRAGNNIARLNQLLKVARQLYRSDLVKSVQDKLRELQAIKIH
ncbi:MAG: hypothetical protein WC472_00580 [Candidatus Paceibacterota bacterium]